MTLIDAAEVRTRLWLTALLVLVALGGAGLASAADRPQKEAQRPELTWRADRNAQPWISALADELQTVDGFVVDLSRHGRDVLGRATALDVDHMNEAVAAGDQVSNELDDAVGHMLAVREDALATIEEWRLGPPARTLFEQLAGAATGAQEVSASWQGLAADAQRVAGLVDALLRHDGLVFRATTAGRQANWDDALSFLQQALVPMVEATEIRNVLASNATVDTLDDLLERYRAFDGALTDLYTYIRDTGRREGRDFDALQTEVDRAQAALPVDTSAMSVIVAEAAGPSITEALVAIERSHGDILEALAGLRSSEP